MDRSQALKDFSCVAVWSSAPAISSIVSITRCRMATPTSSAGVAVPVPKRIQPGEWCVIEAQAFMSFKLGFVESVFSRRCNPGLDRVMPLALSASRNSMGVSCALSRARRSRCATLPVAVKVDPVEFGLARSNSNRWLNQVRHWLIAFLDVILLTSLHNRSFFVSPGTLSLAGSLGRQISPAPPVPPIRPPPIRPPPLLTYPPR